MSEQQLEESVRQLSDEEFAKFVDWFDAHCLTRGAADADDDVEDAELSTSQRAEIERRLAALNADPSLAVPWEGTMDVVRKIRERIQAAKTADRR